MTKEEFVSILNDSPIRLEVVLRRPEEDEALLLRIQELESENAQLSHKLQDFRGCVSDNIGLRSRLKLARRLFKSHGISCNFLDDL